MIDEACLQGDGIKVSVYRSTAVLYSSNSQLDSQSLTRYPLRHTIRHGHTSDAPPTREPGGSRGRSDEEALRALSVLLVKWEV